MPVLTYKEIDRLSEGDRAVNRASHDYYQAVLRGASDQELQRLLQTWLGEIHKRWPDILSQTTNPGPRVPRRKQS